MIIITDNGYVDHTSLTKEEARIFIGFLKQEQARHRLDITSIQSTVIYLDKKFNLKYVVKKTPLSKYKWDRETWHRIDRIISYLFRTGQKNLSVDAAIVRDTLMSVLEELREVKNDK